MVDQQHKTIFYSKIIYYNLLTSVISIKVLCKIETEINAIKTCSTVITITVHWNPEYVCIQIFLFDKNAHLKKKKI